MEYIKLIISVDDAYQESLIAELSEIGFDAFEQQEGKTITYISTEAFDGIRREYIEQILAAYPGDGHIKSEEIVAEKNWNRQWEETIRAIEIGRFCVKPTWSREEVPGDSILLEIDPKMSFGTGYHATTRLMLKLMPGAIEKEDIVMDAGTGTGILAIASIKLGAAEVFAFDTDDWSINNAAENILLNNVSEKVTIEKGAGEVIPVETKFDVVLANINRNTILELLPVFSDAIKKDGIILLSGLLEKDHNIMNKALESSNFELLEKLQEGKWIGLKAKRVK